MELKNLKKELTVDKRLWSLAVDGITFFLLFQSTCSLPWVDIYSLICYCFDFIRSVFTHAQRFPIVLAEIAIITWKDFPKMIDRFQFLFNSDCNLVPRSLASEKTSGKIGHVLQLDWSIKIARCNLVTIFARICTHVDAIFPKTIFWRLCPSIIVIYFASVWTWSSFQLQLVFKTKHIFIVLPICWKFRKNVTFAFSNHLVNVQPACVL